MSEKYNSNFLKYIKNKYDIEVESEHFETHTRNIRISVYIYFYPKEYSTMAPKDCVSFGEWLYSKSNNKLSFENFVYIRGSEMPVLEYTNQEYILDNFCEDLGFKEVNQVLNSLGYNVSFSSGN